MAHRISSFRLVCPSTILPDEMRPSPGANLTPTLPGVGVFFISSLADSASGGGCVGVERPASARRDIERIGEAQRQTFGASPGDHRPIIRAEILRWDDELITTGMGRDGQALAQHHVGCDTASDDKAAHAGRDNVICQRHGIFGAISQHVGDGRLKRGRQIGLILLGWRLYCFGGLPQGGFQAGK